MFIIFTEIILSSYLTHYLLISKTFSNFAAVGSTLYHRDPWRLSCWHSIGMRLRHPGTRGYVQYHTLFIIIMAKSNSFFGLRRGSTKSLTFAVNDGMQITKDRVTEVKNPRSKAQMAQRCLLKTMSLAYSAMKSILDHSFEGIPYGARSMRHFQSINFNLIKAARFASQKTIGFAKYGDSTPNLGQYVIAQGSLNQPNFHGFNVSVQGSGISIAVSDVTTVADFATKLGIGLGELITVCAQIQSSKNAVAFAWVRFTLPNDATASVSDIKVESNLSVEASFESGVSAVVTVADFGADTAKGVLYTAIRSKYSQNGWLRSKAILNLVSGTLVYEDDYKVALNTYPTGQEYPLNGSDSSNAGGGGGGIEYYTIAASADMEGYNVVGPAKVVAGTEATFKLNQTGSGRFQKADWMVDGQKKGTTTAVSQEFKFTPTANCTLVAQISEEMI